MNFTQQGIPYFVSADRVTQIFKPEMVRKNPLQFDMPTVAAYLDDKTPDQHLGEISFFAQRSTMLKGMTIDILKDRKIMETGADGVISYDIPVFTNDQCIVKRDTSKAQERPGIDNGAFTLTLSDEFKPGDILGTDLYAGQQVIVTDDTVIQKGDSFEHKVILSTNDKKDYYSPSNLMEGIVYFKIGHVMFGERGTNYSGIHLPQKSGYMTCEFQLGDSSGVEMSVSAMADINTQLDQVMLNEVGMDYNNFAEKFGDITVTMDRDSKGSPIPATRRLAILAESLVKREHARLMDQKAMFAKSATVSFGTGKSRVSEGLWWQLKRGKNIKYARPGGITREHISEMVEYIFKGNQHLQDYERKITIKAGTLAEQNIKEIFAEEFKDQLGRLSNNSNFLGMDGQLPSPIIEGPLDDLKLNIVRIGEIMIPNIGFLKVERDMALDYLGQNPGDRFLAGGMHPQGKSHGAYCAVVWDANNQAYSNNLTAPRGATLVEGAPQTSSLYLLKRPGAMIHSGRTNNHYDPYTVQGVVSSGNKSRSVDFYSWDTGASYFLQDPTAFCMIELSEQARKGFN
jgi:hypothetical protein